MEHYFRTAVWMLLLIGCFQAAPILDKTDIDFELLRKNVEFEGNVTFKFPKDVSNSCLGDAVHTIIEGLKQAGTHTTSKDGQIGCSIAIDALVNANIPDNKSSDCKMQEERSLKFEDFVNEFETFIVRINSI